MIYIKEKIPTVINLNFQQEENNYGIITITSKEPINKTEINLYYKKNQQEVPFALGYFTHMENTNNLFIYTYNSINYKKYREFTNTLFEKHKDLLITHNPADMENNFININPLTHETYLNKDINPIMNLEEYETYIIKKNLNFIKNSPNIKVNLFYPIIEIHQEFVFTIYEDDPNVDIINNILNNWQEHQKKRILKLTYETDMKAYVIKIPHVLYTRKILEYTYEKNEFLQEEEKTYKEINIYYESIKLKPKTTWGIIKNMAYNSYVYNNPVCKLEITLKYMPENLYINGYVKYEDLFFKIIKINVNKNHEEFYCEITCILYKNIEKKEKLDLEKSDNQILEPNYNIKFEEIFFYNEEDKEVILREKLYKNYTYRKTRKI